MRLLIWGSEKPWFLKRAMTESGLSGFSKSTTLDTAKADSGDNPHLFMRYETENEC